MYFLLSGIVNQFVYLKYALSAILTFVGAKMLIVDLYHVPILVSLGFILLTLATSIVASLIAPVAVEKATASAESTGGSSYKKRGWRGLDTMSPGRLFLRNRR